MPSIPNTAEMAKAQRRWFQFRLRTLLIVVMVLAVPFGWFGWQVGTISYRKAALDLIVSSGGSYLTNDGWQFFRSFPVHRGNGGDVHESPLRESDFAKAPAGLRRWLGDPTIIEIWLPKAASAAVIKQTEALPEARVWQAL